ncbi:MAG: methyltransferase domain-containing protein [Chloroflexi bacterium]|nr:methyltransferase domain-containing protein [Chloroflexota bacterium]
MDICGCDGFAEEFDRATAEGDLERFRQSGPDPTTRMLLEKLEASRAAGATVLDIGGGIGVVAQELLRAGAGHAVLVDASPASLAVARQAARDSNLLDRLQLVEGDFVRHAGAIDRADIVTLDRVVCCYRHVDALVGLASARAGRLLGLVLPRDRWLVRTAIRFMNVGFRLRRRAYRAYAHSNAHIDRLAASNGLQPRSESGTFFWRVVVYERRAAS